MSREYPFIMLMKIISSFNYKSGYIKNWDDNEDMVTINEICHIVGINTSDINHILSIWSYFDLASEYKQNNKRYLKISDKVISNIQKGNIIRYELKNTKSRHY